MREILFRGKRKDNGEWIKGFYIKATHHWHEHGIHEDWIAVDTIQNGGWCNVRGKYAVIPETVGQFTGLYDKNGTKIFEGDIIAYKYKTNPYLNTFTIGHCIVEYIETLGVYSPFGDSGLALEANEIEVVGNIHDNPDILGGR